MICKIWAKWPFLSRSTFFIICIYAQAKCNFLSLSIPKVFKVNGYFVYIHYGEKNDEDNEFQDFVNVGSKNKNIHFSYVKKRSKRPSAIRTVASCWMGFRTISTSACGRMRSATFSTVTTRRVGLTFITKCSSSWYDNVTRSSCNEGRTSNNCCRDRSSDWRHSGGERRGRSNIGNFHFRHQMQLLLQYHRFSCMLCPRWEASIYLLLVVRRPWWWELTITIALLYLWYDHRNSSLVCVKTHTCGPCLEPLWTCVVEERGGEQASMEKTLRVVV